MNDRSIKNFIRFLKNGLTKKLALRKLSEKMREVKMFFGITTERERTVTSSENKRADLNFSENYTINNIMLKVLIRQICNSQLAKFNIERGYHCI